MIGWRKKGKFYHAVNVNQERYPEQALCGNTPQGRSGWENAPEGTKVTYK